MSGWKVQYKNGGYQWTLIGKMNPQLPQMFYPVLDDITLTKGDIVVRTMGRLVGPCMSWAVRRAALILDSLWSGAINVALVK